MLRETYGKLLDMFDPRERRRFYMLCGLMVAMGAVEALGVASILPFLAVVARPSIVEEQPLFRELFRLSGAADIGDFLVMLGFAVFAIFVFSLLMRSLTVYALARFAQMRAFSISTRMMRGYLREPYAWHLQSSSADLASVILNQADQLANRSLLPALSLLRSIVSAVFLVGLVVTVDPKVAILAALVLGGSYMLIYRLVRGRITRLGEQRKEVLNLRYRLVQEAFGGIKEIKTLGIEERYADRFVWPSLIAAQSEATTRVIAELPRNFLEGIAFGGMLLLVILNLTAHSDGIAGLLPTLGLYAFAGVRLFPAMQYMYYDSISIRFSLPLLRSVHSEMMSRTKLGATPLHTGPVIRLGKAIELDEVCFRYAGAARNALDHVTLRIPARTRVGFVGGTGAGKTTAIDIIMGLLEPESGTLRVDGTAIGADNARAWRGALGYVPQQIYLSDDSVAANIAFGVLRDDINMAAVERAARIAELHGFVTTDLPQGYATQVGERGVRLSGGQRQRIGIARALYRDPDVLVLDEATSALDNLTEQAVMDALRNIGRAKTVIIIAHRLTTVRDCDRIFLMERGKVVAEGDYDALVARNDLFRRMAGRA